MLRLSGQHVRDSETNLINLSKGNFFTILPMLTVLLSSIKDADIWKNVIM